MPATSDWSSAHAGTWFSVRLVGQVVHLVIWCAGAQVTLTPQTKYYYITRFSCLEARCVCRQAAVKAAKILPLVGLARYKQDPINRGHDAQYLYRPQPAGAETKYEVSRIRTC